MQTKTQPLFASLFLPLLTIGAIILVLVLYLPSQAAGSGTYTVNTTLDNIDGPCNVAHCSLREAILAANGTVEADTILFSLPPSSTITLNGSQLPIITETLTIDGSTAENLTISGSDASRVLVIGAAPPPYPVAPESSNNALGSSAAVTLTNLTVTEGNEAFHLGGAIFNDGALTIVDSTISHTTSKHGAVYNNNTLVISNSTFISNTVVETYGGGAGIYNTGTGVVTVTNSAFISNTVFASQAAGGGGIYNNGGDVTISSSLFSGNYANWFGGGAIGSVFNGELNISNSTFTNNSASISNGRGGAVRASGSVSIVNSTFNGNFADDGGAIWTFSSSSNVAILNSTFYDNSADSDGGAVNIDSPAILANSTFSGNSAQRGGGIMISDFAGALTMNNNTITGNSASPNGGGVFNLRLLHMSNNIIANSIGLTDCFSTTALGTNINNLVEDGSCNAPLSGDPMLGPLQDNDGDTLTHALLEGSPAIDTGHNATCAAAPVNNLDQRGYARPIDGDGNGTATCDIGSFEAEKADFYINKSGPATAVPGEFITYTLAVINNLPIPVTGVILTDTIPANATYISGGTQVGGVVSWTLPGLAAGAAFSRSFVVTATETITNDDYRVSADGGFGTRGSAAVVTVVAEQISGLTAANDSPTIVGNATTLGATVATGSLVDYTWAFGDGDMGSGAVVAHTYPAVGIYTAVVTASNPINSVSTTTVVTVTDAPITGLSATNNSPTNIGNSTTLMASVTSGTNVSYTWAFGDGQTGSGANTAHIYPAVGMYTAVVTASNSVSTLTATTVVNIIDVAITGLTAGNDSPTTLGEVTNLVASVASGTNVSYAWAFGDGATGSGANPSHIYPDVGVYTAVVTASNSTNMVTASTVVTIEPDEWSIYLPVVLKPAVAANQPSQPDSQNLTAFTQSHVAIIPRRPGPPGFQ